MKQQARAGRVEVHIDRICLRGIAPCQEKRVVAELQARLRACLREPPMLERLMRERSVDRLVLGKPRP